MTFRSFTYSAAVRADCTVPDRAEDMNIPRILSPGLDLAANTLINSPTEGWEVVGNSREFLSLW